jgi:uncharacterized phage protein gp47/JayE
MSDTSALPTTPVCYIDQLGIHAPTYLDVLAYLQQQVQSIYGADIYLGNDSQDGQLIALFALAIHEANSMALAVYQAFSPATAQGAGLSSVVKINGIKRNIATNSVVDLVLVGQAGTPIINGVVRDDNQNNWLLPGSVTIPISGQIVVTAIAAASGAISAPAGSVTTILTPTRGWQSAINPQPATTGDPLESDAALRARQTVSTALPSLTVLDGIIGAVAELPGVTRYAAYENDTGATDPNGIPAHSISFVVDGGEAARIAYAIMLKKTPGASTYGTTTVAVTDPYGVTKNISFFRPLLVPVTVAITIQPLAGFTTATEADIVNAIVAYINTLPIGVDVLLTKLYGPANLAGSVSTTFNIVGLGISRGAGNPVPQDVVIGFNEVATASASNVNLTALVT